jgi:hypothetical protein
VGHLRRRRRQSSLLRRNGLALLGKLETWPSGGDSVLGWFDYQFRNGGAGSAEKRKRRFRG